LIAQLSKQLNELDSTFQLHEGPYTFEHELQARDIMEAAYAEYICSSCTAVQRRAITPPSITSIPSITTTDNAVQEGPDQGGTGGGSRDAVIDIPLRMDSEKADGGDIDDSEVVLDNEQPEIP
jgi:hypothetical protein